jgi:transposase
MRGRVFTREFKIECVRQVTSGEKRPAQVCREQSLSESVLLRWRKEVEARGEAGAFTIRDVSELSDVERLQRRVAELERYLGELSLENHVLKKLAQAAQQRSGTR